MDDEKLILLVQGQECLYNKYSPGYKNPEKNRMIWEQISEEMGRPEDLCQKRWSCLRDRFVKEKRQENSPSGSGAKYASQWPFMQTLDFIAHHVVPRSMRCSFNINKESSQFSPQSPLSEPSSLSASSPLSVSEPLPELPANALMSTPTIPAILSKRKRQSETSEDQSITKAVDAFTKMCENKVEKQEEVDAITGFGQVIVSTIRSMSQTKQIVAMQRVMSLVMEMKLEPDCCNTNILFLMATLLSTVII